MKVAAVLLAGGTGSRIDSRVPKQFIDVLGKPLMIRTLEKLAASPMIEHICISCNHEYMSLMRDLIEKYGITKSIDIVPGGNTGLESTFIGIKNIPDEFEAIIIHDANRPLIDDDILNDCRRVYKKHGNAVSAIKAVELTYQSTDGASSNTYLDRDSVWKTHTPQMYNRAEALEAYEEAFKNGDPGYASTTELYVAQGKTIFFSKSKSDNIKITYPEDLKLLEALLICKER
ncbi:MAG: 2-C-methyl-D-erythritol 4-phosphate cytidylyltransferase [Thermoplasmata archaeon]|nr:2-C-methyl-D-erythritol 4-phosphate cytidylyltransferase [Thermoplasmata archaeon]